ncbi:MAG: endonuclease/exonuclease/phosphatase family protein [Desulfobacteraceae bacterium]|nr:endonuclease/exonuclease/phosphatase family protein [Desulfobacteraceae bacterium]MCF8093782.1 endonuclease/exonuclease/phosphatase family protein [Desulfobacteraceae bacterium]
MKLRVMTFNLRFENDQDGKNAWHNRREMILRMIEFYMPDILGTQEGKWDQLMYLRKNLPEYAAHMPDRPEDKHAQCPTLFIRKDRFAIVGGRDFWLSKTPEIHLSKDWDSAFPRMMSYAVLEPASTGHGRLCTAVTHLDHMGRKARFRQAEIIAEWARGLDSPLVLMGDFNEEPDADVYRLLTAPGVGLSDTWRSLGRDEWPESYTHHAFTGFPKGNRIDWILVGPSFAILDAMVVKYREKGYYPSDHFPYLADLELRM